eukprot:1156328-Pelagomonas_calceolata.AAC.12
MGHSKHSSHPKERREKGMSKEHKEGDCSGTLAPPNGSFVSLPIVECGCYATKRNHTAGMEHIGSTKYRGEVHAMHTWGEHASCLMPGIRAAELHL